MSPHLTCPNGHRWQPPENGSDSATQSSVCPICENAADGTVAWQNAPGGTATGSRLHLPGGERSTHAAPVAAAATAHAPSIDGYEILEPVGRGGMGIVYKARHLRLKRLVALKMIRGGAGADEQERSRFRTEAEAAARLQHPGIVQIYEVGEQEGQPFLALEFVEGGTLSQALAGQVLPARPAAELVETLARAMHYAHQRGVVHRDLKPGNVMLSEPASPAKGSSQVGGGPPAPLAAPKITDFGLAKRLDDDHEQTRTGQILGTPSYMAPEQASGSGREIGPPADVYALGAILYELVTGRPPFRAATALETLEQVRSQEPVSPRRLQPGLPRDLETVCLKCLQKDPRERYATALDLADDLRRVIDGEPIRARPVGPFNRLWRWCRRKPGLAGLSAALLIVAATSFAALTFLWRTSEAHRRRAELTSANLVFDQGQSIAEQGDVGRGMLLMARALGEIPAVGEDLRATIRSSLSHWSLEVRPMRGLFAHDDLLRTSTFSPDGTMIATGDQSGTVCVWDPATGEPIGPPLRHTTSINLLAFCLEGRVLVAAGYDGLRRWDARTGKPLGPAFSLEKDRWNCFAASPDGRTICLGLRARLGETWEEAASAYQRWDVATGEFVGELIVLPERGMMEWMRFSPDGRLLSTRIANRKLIRVLEISDPAAPKLLQSIEAVDETTFSPDSGRMISSFGRQARVCDARTGEPIGSPLMHSAAVTSMAISPDGGVLATVSNDGAVRLWDMTTDSPLGGALEYGDYVPRSLSFHPDGGLLLTSGNNRAARLWDVSRSQSPETVLVELAPINGIALASDGRTIATACESNSTPIRLWNRETRTALDAAVSEKGFSRMVAAAADALVFVAGSQRGAQPINARTGESVGPVALSSGPVSAVAVSPDGKTMLTGTYTNVVQRWDPATGRQLGESAKLPGQVRALAFRRDGAVYLTGCDQRSLRLWDSATGQPTGPSFDPPAAVLAAVFSPDGRSIAVALADKTARQFDAETGRLRGPAMRHENVVLAIAYGPDGRTVLTGCGDGTGRLWDAATGKPLGPQMRHEGNVWGVAFTRDGRTALTAGEDKIIRFRDVPPAIDGDDDQVARWVQVMTGQELDANGAVRDLDAAEWWERREKLGGMSLRDAAAPADSSARRTADR